MIKPPEGYDTWLDYAVDFMPTRDLYLQSIGGENWGRTVERSEMREAAKKELDDLRRGHDR